MKRLLIVSADNHAGGRCGDYLPFLEPKYHQALENQIAEEREFLTVERGFGAASDNVMSAVEIIDKRNAMRNGGELGAWDVEKRLKVMDDEGIAAEIVNVGHHLSLTPFFTMLSRPHSAELRSAGARAHHRWFAETMAPGKGRMFGVGDPGGCEDIDAAVREIDWIADHGFVAMGCPHGTEDKQLPPLYDEKYFEPFWQAVRDRGLVLSVHFGYNVAQGKFFQFLERAKADPGFAAAIAKGTLEDFIKAVQDVKNVDLRPRQAFWQLVQGGVFDRYPDLKVVFSEVRSDWLPGTLAYLDERFEAERGIAKLKPSEYFQRQCYVTPSSPRPSEVSQRGEVGIDRMLLGVDYPHPEGTWPNTWDWLRSIFTDFSEMDARKFAGLNAIKLFKLDEMYLTEVAERIGPEVNDVVASRDGVDPELIAHFHFRSGYKSPAEVVDRELLARAVEDDLQAMRHRSRHSLGASGDPR